MFQQVLLKHKVGKLDLQHRGLVFEYNHTLQVNLFSNLPFFKAGK